MVATQPEPLVRVHPVICCSCWWWSCGILLYRI